MVLFRCVTGGTGGFEIAITTEDTDLYGQIITISKNGSTVGTTVFDNTGNASYTVTETGTYSVSVTYDGRTVTETVEVTAFAVDLAMGFVFEKWLEFGDISGTYASLSDVLADEEAVRQLMTIHAAVDYLADQQSTDTDVVTILNNDYAAKWISLRDYAEDALEAVYGTLMASIGKYGYGEWGLVGKVPKMTSNTAPSGEVVYSTQYDSTNFLPWHAFDGDKAFTSYGWIGAPTDSAPYIGYKSTTPIKAKKAVVMVQFRTFTNANSTVITVEGSNDNSTYHSIGSLAITGIDVTSDNVQKTYEIPLADEDFYLYHRIKMNYSMRPASTNFMKIVEVQFYAWGALGNVPVMTSASAPYGEVTASSAYNSEARTQGWTVFSQKDDGTYEWYSAVSDANPWVQYKFTNPVCAKRVRVKSAGGWCAGTWEVYGSNDGSTWSNSLGSLTFTSESVAQDNYATLTNDEYYLYYRVKRTQGSASGGYNSIMRIVQFYGRTLKVSVPKMSGNTTPYGTVDVTNYISGGSHAGFKAFDGGTPSTSDHCWVGYDPNLSASYGGQSGPVSISYDFDNPVVVKQVSMKLADQSSGNGMEFTIDGYDGSEWISLKSVAQKTSGSQTSFNQFSYDVDNNVAYTKYRLNITRFTGSAAAWGNASSTNYWCAVVGALNFFGFDYSEREWDTSHPRRYLYDHGVEVETLDASSFTVDTTYSITGNVKNPSDLELHSPSGNYSSSFGTNAMIDNSGGDYSLLFVNINQARLGTTPLIMSVATTKAAYTNNRLGLLNPSVPYSGSLQALDVSNILQSFYCVLDAPSNRWANVNEWWLE